MLTPDVDKYLQTQFENESTSEEVVEDLVKGGWREADAKTVVRQFETKDTLEHAPPKPPKTSKPKKKDKKIDFSQVSSHGGDVEIGKDFAPKEESFEPSKIHQETEGKKPSVKEQKQASQQKKQQKAEDLLSSHTNMDASYEELTLKMPTTHDRKDIHRNDGQSDAYKEPETSFSPLDLKPQRGKNNNEISQKTQSSPPKISRGDSKRKRVFGMLALVWLLVVGIIVFLYITFVQSDSGSLGQVSNTPTVTLSENSEIPQTNTTCESDINCFVQEGSKCLTPVSVEKVKVNSFFSSRQKVSTFLEVIPQREGDCLFTSRVLSVETEFTGDVAEDTQRNIQAVDQESIGLEGSCLISSNDIGGFLQKVRDGSLSDLDVLSAECEGPYYDQDSLTF